ncbi:hypothetical protein [Rhodanobacter geophilus]|uniref:Uncharacterized protein n=1 Tax=Rhodanobacter geophilus TaxID=3162488 RepID=A0ABV3QTJ0_9GAMM
MNKILLEKFLAYFSASLGFLSALAAAFIMGIAFITAGQRAPYSAGAACLGSAVLLFIVAASLFRKTTKAQRLIAVPARYPVIQVDGFASAYLKR